MVVTPAGAASGRSSGAASVVVLLPFVLVSFAANSLITRYVVTNRLLDAGLLGAVRFIAGAVALVGIVGVRRERLSVGRANLGPAFWLAVYALSLTLLVAAVLVGGGMWLGRPAPRTPVG